MDYWERRLPDFSLAVLVSALATIISAPVLPLLGSLWSLPFWLLDPGFFLLLVLLVYLVGQWVPPIRVGVAIISQRRSTVNILYPIELIASSMIALWLAATLSPGVLRAADLAQHGAPLAMVSFLQSLPAVDYTLALLIVVSMVLTFVLDRRNRSIAISADECYLMLRQIESQRNERFEFEPEASLNQLRRQGRILDYLYERDHKASAPLSSPPRDSHPDRAGQSGALGGLRRYNVTRAGVQYLLDGSPFQNHDNAQPWLTSTQLQDQLCEAANEFWELGGKERRWRVTGEKAKPIRHGKLFGNHFDDLFNRGEGFAFYPTGGADFVTMVIKGPPGAGKSTLALQMCVAQAQLGNVCLYFSFEDERGSLVQSARNFGWDAAANLPADAEEERETPVIYEGVLNLPVKQSRKRLEQLTKSPVTQPDKKTGKSQKDQQAGDSANHAGVVLVSSFGRRAMSIRQRLQLVRKVWGSGLGDLRSWTHVARCVVIDSLEGFANAGPIEGGKPGVTRGQLLDLKRFFRHRCDLLIILVEDDGSQLAGFSEFIADAVIALGRREENDYTVLFAEILKARNQTHALGKTQIKIRSRIDLDNAREAVRASVDKLMPGILVFPSLHYRLFQSQQESFFDTYTLSTGFSGFDEMLTPVAGQTGSASTPRGGLRRKTATTLLGPRDTGKSILAMNFLIEGVRENSRTLLLSLREDPSAVTDVKVPQEEGRIRFSWQKAPKPDGQVLDLGARDTSEGMLYHQLEWDLDGVLQWREEHISQETDKLPYTQQLMHKRWRLPFLFQQTPVSYANLDTDPQTIAQAESVIQFLQNFSESLDKIHANSPDTQAQERRLLEKRAPRKLIRWTHEARLRASVDFESAWKDFVDDLLARTLAYERLTRESVRRLAAEQGLEENETLNERAQREVAGRLLALPLAANQEAGDPELRTFAQAVSQARADCAAELTADAEKLRQHRDRVLLRDPDDPDMAKRIRLSWMTAESAQWQGRNLQAVQSASGIRALPIPCLRWDSRRWDFDRRQVVSGAQDDDSLLVVKGFRPGNITADDFIDQVLRIIGDPRSGKPSRFERVVFDDVTQLHQRFPILDKTRLFIPTLIDMFKARGITSLFIADVDDFEVSKYNEAVRDQDHGLGVIADQVIRTRLLTHKTAKTALMVDTKTAGEASVMPPRPESSLVVEARAKAAIPAQRPHEIYFDDSTRADGAVSVELIAME